ncbi:MAG TPA: aminotransferase [Lachnospiraceae bacterium]|nr:aminotransferase [Lachnospiraceae bacterium]
MKYKYMSVEELKKLEQRLNIEYENIKTSNLSLDMSRGKPASAQLDLSNDILAKPIDNYITSEGIDSRNYGILDGITEIKTLFSSLLDIPNKNIIIGGNSSLNLIYDAFARLYIFGADGSEPWGKCKTKILCPVPGYDRHFAICEEFGFEMINIPMTDEGPDMDMVENLVKEDENIKGIICVPLYSNPDGICYSDSTVERLSCMQTKAKDFKIFWDNAYAIHHVYKEHKLANIFSLSKKYGTDDRIIYFFSTSKITFPGSGVAMIASGDNYIEEIKKHFGIQTIGHNKLNQLRTFNFFHNAEGVKEHMKKLGDLLKEKFDIVLNTLDKEVADKGILKWNKPDGGYFISVFALPGCASETVKLAREAGLVLTGAGATYPYHNDPEDSNIRLAPSYPTCGELQKAIDIFCVCLKLATIRKLIEQKEQQ